MGNLVIRDLKIISFLSCLCRGCRDSVWRLRQRQPRLRYIRIKYYRLMYRDPRMSWNWVLEMLSLLRYVCANVNHVLGNIWGWILFGIKRKEWSFWYISSQLHSRHLGRTRWSRSWDNLEIEGLSDYWADSFITRKPSIKLTCKKGQVFYIRIIEYS